MKLFIAYLKQHQKGILALFLFCGIFSACFCLYHLPLGAVWYPTFLCTILGFLFLLADFSTTMQRHGKLCELQHLTAEMIADLPVPTGIEDKDYQALVRQLQREVTANETLAAVRYRDMVDYYTIWVHQIKTPITSMRLSLEKEDTVLSRKLSSDLFQIEQYVEMVLAFLRLDSDSSDYCFREYDLDDIIRQSISKFAAEFIARRIRLEYTSVNKKVITDDKWLSFVIEQVLSNALKYTREGSIKIYLQESETLCIEDTGIGIAPEDLPRVFEKGYTGYNGRKDKRASGIGLYLCKRICERLGTEIRIVSELDRGTIVRISLEQYQFKKD